MTPACLVTCQSGGSSVSSMFYTRDGAVKGPSVSGADCFHIQDIFQFILLLATDCVPMCIVAERLNSRMMEELRGRRFKRR